MYNNMRLTMMDTERQFEVTHVNLVLNPSGVASPGGQPLALERRPSRCLVTGYGEAVLTPSNTGLF